MSLLWVYFSKLTDWTFYLIGLISSANLLSSVMSFIYQEWAIPAYLQNFLYTLIVLQYLWVLYMAWMSFMLDWVLLALGLNIELAPCLIGFISITSPVNVYSFCIINCLLWLFNFSFLILLSYSSNALGMKTGSGKGLCSPAVLNLPILENSCVFGLLVTIPSWGWYRPTGGCFFYALDYRTFSLYFLLTSSAKLNFWFEYMDVYFYPTGPPTSPDWIVKLLILGYFLVISSDFDGDKGLDDAIVSFEIPTLLVTSIYLSSPRSCLFPFSVSWY